MQKVECVHPEYKSSAHKLRYTRTIRGNGAHAGCTAFILKCAPGIKMALDPNIDTATWTFLGFSDMRHGLLKDSDKY